MTTSLRLSLAAAAESVPPHACLSIKGVAMAHRRLYGLLLVGALLTSVPYAEYLGRHLGPGHGQTMASGGGQAASGERRGIGNSGAKRYIYAAFNDGSMHVYDIDDGHREIATFNTVGGVTDVRGVCASAATGTWYLAHQTRNGGSVIAVDLSSHTVLWNKLYQPNVDRLSCTPDGRKLYIW